MRHEITFFTSAQRWVVRCVRGSAYGLLAFGVWGAPAQTSEPWLGSRGGATSANPLGGLILSPAQRRGLEAARSIEGDAKVLVEGSSGEGPAGLPDTLVVSGVVVRSGNRNTIWVNDQPLYGPAAASPLRTLAGQMGVLQKGRQDMPLKAKPGQVIDVPSGMVVDLLPPGAIRIIPPKASGSDFKKRVEQ